MPGKLGAPLGGRPPRIPPRTGELPAPPYPPGRSCSACRPAAADRQMLVAVVGATATGKSDLAVNIARAVGGEVINADSMQLYRGMDIGTAKLSLAERQGIPHHLLDIWDVCKTATVAEYQVLAREV